MSKVLIVGGVTLLITLTSLGLMAYNTEAHCKVKTGDMTTTGCTSTFKKACDFAYAVSLKTEGAIEVSTSYSCPFNAETATLGLLGLIMTLACLVVVFLTHKGKDLKTVVLTLTAVILPVLLTNWCLMIRDLKKGYDYKEDQKLEEGFRPGSYIATIILVFFSMCLISAAAFLTHRGNKNNTVKQMGA